LAPKELAQTIMDSYEENAVDLVFFKNTFYRYNYGRMEYEAVDVRKLYSRMRSISPLTTSKDLLSETLNELSKIARQGLPKKTLESEFCRKFLIKSPASKIRLDELYQRYKKWCIQKGYSPSEQTVLRKEIEVRFGVVLKRLRLGRSLHKGFSGIALKTKYL
jgi:hypothetical protein